jgi:hypothetical protein
MLEESIAAPSERAPELSAARLRPDPWSALAHRRLFEILEGLERWRRATLADFDPHAALKLRAHARRFELAGQVFAPEIAGSPRNAEILSALEHANEILLATTDLRSHDLCTDYFHSVYRGLGDSTAAEAAEIYSDWLYEVRRSSVLDATEAALRAIAARRAGRARKALRELAGQSAELPSASEATPRLRVAGRRAFEALRPLVVGFDQSAIGPARAEVRALRYAWKALRPCFPDETYRLNHDHAHRLQTILGQAGDIEAWVLAAEGFAEHADARRKGVRPQDWDRVLRYAWAQRLNLLHQVGRHALVRHWLQREGLSADVVRPVRPDLGAS